MIGTHSRTSARLLGGLAAVTLALAACGGDENVTKAGGDDEPIVLRFGTDDFPDRPAADQILEFGRRVAELTDGDVRIEGVWEAGRAGDGRRWDQRVAQQVIDGELDGGNVPARAWDLMGVRSMVAFHAPFLITTTEAMNAVVTDAGLAADMLAGLDGTGVTGLGIAPDTIRYLFGFRDPFPLVSPTGFEGALIRSPASATTWATFEALGARPDDIPDMGPAIDDGSLVGMESSFGFVDGAPNVSAVGNLPLFPKANVFVINDEAFAELSDEHRDALRAAAEATRDWAISTNVSVAEAAIDFCTAEGSVLHATAADVDAIHARVAPVLVDLRADSAVADMMDRIQAIVDGVTAGPAPAACAVAASAATEPPTIDAEALEGTYRFPLDEDDMRAGGVPESWIERNDLGSTVITLTLADGTVSAEDLGKQIPGTYTVSGSVVTFRIDDWASHWAMTPTFTDDGIAWTYVDSFAPWASDEDKLVDKAFWTTRPWTRIAAG